MRQTGGVDFVERRIQQGQRAGAFDDLALHGQPIPDLDSERPEGWWGAELVARDRRLRSALELAESLKLERRRALAGTDHATLAAELRRLAAAIAEANAELEPNERIEWFDVEADLATWRHHERVRRFGVDLDASR